MSPKTFYETYKNCTQSLVELPKNLNSIELARHIANSKFGYINLDCEFDYDQFLYESSLVMPFYVNHREGDNHKGWQSCCLHGLAIEKTGVWSNYYDVEPDYHYTELKIITPNIVKFWDSMPFEKLLRVRFMLVEPGGYVYPHNDSPGDLSKMDLLNHIVPINLAIVHPDDCYMVLKDYGIVPWSQGDVKLINITNDHCVINNSMYNRIHMIGHGIVGNKINEFSELLVKSYEHTRVSTQYK